MDCRKFLEQLDAFIDGELTPGAKAAMENHMNNCPECKKLYEDAKEILMKTNELNDVKAPEGFTDAVMEKLQNDDITIFRTDKNGTIICKTKGNGPSDYKWVTEK